MVVVGERVGITCGGHGAEELEALWLAGRGDSQGGFDGMEEASHVTSPVFFGIPDDLKLMDF